MPHPLPLPARACVPERIPAGPSARQRLAFFLLVCVLLPGCGETKTTAKTHDHSTTKTQTTHTPTADGGWVERTVTVRDGIEDSESSTRTELDEATAAWVKPAAGALGATIGAATGTPALPWGEIIGGAATVAMAGWAALKHGQVTQLKQERDFHKSDADMAYKKLGVG